MNSLTSICKHILLVFITGVAMIALFMFIGEESPGNPLSLFEFIALKAVAAIALYSCYSIGKYLFHNSLLPDWFVRCLTDIDEDMEDTHEDYFNNIQK